MLKLENKCNWLNYSQQKANLKCFLLPSVQKCFKGEKKQHSIWKVYDVFEVSVWFSLIGANDTNF